MVFQPLNGWPGDVGIYDAIFDVCEGPLQGDQLNNIKLNWNTGNRPMILYFTDEEGQETYHELGLTQDQVAAECLDAGISSAGFLGLGRDATISEYAYISGSSIFLINSTADYANDLDQVFPPLTCQ